MQNSASKSQMTEIIDLTEESFEDVLSSDYPDSSVDAVDLVKSPATYTQASWTIPAESQEYPMNFGAHPRYISETRNYLAGTSVYTPINNNSKFSQSIGKNLTLV